MSRPLVFVAGDRTFRMISCILDTLDDLCLVCLIVFGQLSHTLIGRFAVQRQCLRISGCTPALRPCLPCISANLIPILAIIRVATFLPPALRLTMCLPL